MKCACCNKELTKEKSCSYKGKIYCPKHYQQMLKHGHCLDTIQRTQQDLNDFEFIDDNTVKIITYNRRSIPNGSFLISRCDFERVIAKKWRIWENRIFTGNFKPIAISRFICEEELKEHPDYVVDHINSNPFDNRRENLRVVPEVYNTYNKSMMTNNTSGILGVWRDKNRNKWVAEIGFNHRHNKLGRWDNFYDAVYARYYAEMKIFGNYRSKNNDIKIQSIIEQCQNKSFIEQFVDKKLVNSTH